MSYPQGPPPAYPAAPQAAQPVQAQAQPQYPAGVQVKQPYPAQPQQVPVAAAYPGQPAPVAAAYPAQQVPVATAYQAQPVGVVQAQPGYVVQPAQPQTVVIQQNRGAVYGGGAFGYGYFQYIPCLHIVAAIVVLIFNICGSGLGTIMGGFFVLCCGHPYSIHQSSGELFAWCFLIGFAQMVLTLFSFIGWVWAIIWGAMFISASSNYYGHPFDPNQPATTTTTVITA